MKISKTILYFIIFVFGASGLSAFVPPDSSATVPQFRNVKWDSSIDAVKEKETAHYLQKFSGFGIESLSFQGDIAGFDARIDYTFKNKKFTEGSYTINSSNNFREDFHTLLSFLEKTYGNPDLRAGPYYNSDSIWIKINDYGIYKGPSFYWEFKNGFIALITKKIKEEIEFTILFVSDITIDEYNSKNLVEMKDFEAIKLNK